jgi:hypothetical protein
VSAVDRMVRVNGRDALVKLIRSYHDGVSDDEAFQAALGRDVAGFQSDWLKELGATPPTRVGPRPAPVGPLPSGWEGPRPDPSFEIVGSAPPAPAAPAPGKRGNGEDAISFLVAPLATLGLVVLVVIAAVGFRRLGRRPDPSTWAETGDNRLFGRPPSGQPGGDELPSSSRLWSASDWSLPREPDERAADPTVDPTIDPAERPPEATQAEGSSDAEAGPRPADDPPTGR